MRGSACVRLRNAPGYAEEYHDDDAVHGALHFVARHFVGSARWSVVPMSRFSVSICCDVMLMCCNNTPVAQSESRSQLARMGKTC